MNSKYIKNSRINNRPKLSEYEWSSMGTSVYDREEKKRTEEYYQNLKLEKERIKSIPLEDLSFRDIYVEPFTDLMQMGRIHSGNSFIFQFLSGSKGNKEECLKILNGENVEYKRQNCTNNNGEISIDGHPFILIRGWGNLCGQGSYNLSEEYASKIQDTLAEYIVEKLSK